MSVVRTSRLCRMIRSADRHLPLTAKLAIPLVLMAALSMIAGMMAIGLPALQSELLRAEERRSVAIASLIGSEYETGSDPVRMHSFLLSAVLREPSLRVIRIYRIENGPPVVWSTSEDASVLPRDVDAADVGPIATGATEQTVHALNGRSVLETIVPVRARGRPDATVGVYTSLDGLNDASLRVARDVAVLGLVAFAIETFVTVLIVHFVIVRRIRRLDGAAARVTGGDLTVRLVDGDGDGAGDEIARVTGAFDRMTQAIARQQAAVEKRADTDGLTGLLNRRALDAHLDLEVARSDRLGYPLAFSLVDLDGFKGLNDAAGHLAGDDALRRVGDALDDAVRRTDIVARYGGDEFGVIHPGCDLEHVATVAARIRHAVEALDLPIGSPDGRKVSASVGTALFRPGQAVASLVADADAALYRAKKRGGGIEIGAGEPGMSTTA